MVKFGALRRPTPTNIETPDDLFKLGENTVNYDKLGLSYLSARTPLRVFVAQKTLSYLWIWPVMIHLPSAKIDIEVVVCLISRIYQ